MAPGSVLGGSAFASVDFANQGTILGGLHLLRGDDILRIYTGSVITGTFSGGEGHDLVYLSGSGTDSMAGTFTTFEELYKNGTGTWTLTSPVTDVGLIRVQEGTLILAANNAGFTGAVTVDAPGILQGRGQDLPLVITDDGLVRFAQPDAGVYAGLITGTGWIEKTGAGVLRLLPADPGGNGFTGGTRLTGGVLAVAADNALGAPTAAIVFNGGTLRFDAAFDPAATRPISLLAPGGTIDTNGFTPTIVQGITGAGGLTVTGAGMLTLTGANAYAGGTTIAPGARLRIGAGGMNGSLLGPVRNDGTLVFDRAGTLGFDGAIAGQGSVEQNGPGTTVLNGPASYTGETRVNAGTLRAGAPGVFSASSVHVVGAGGVLDLADRDQTIGGLVNAGFTTLGHVPGTVLTVNGSVVGQGGVIGLTTYLGGDNSPTDRIRLVGGTAGGISLLRVANAGGPGALTLGDGIRVLETASGATTAPGAFRLESRVVAGAYEYQLFRGGSTSGEDWFLRSALPAGPGQDSVPLYRPEVALYAPIPALMRQMGMATLGTLHARVGEEENIRGLESGSPYVNGAWARSFGERSDSRWNGGAAPSAEGDLVGFQAGLDLFRRTGSDGHRDHVGIYVAQARYNADISGTALGVADSAVGKLALDGPAVGAYWTHFGPTGWYVDAVLQASFIDARATGRDGTRLDTDGQAYAASLEAGYPVALGGGWQLEPQAQMIWQTVDVANTTDAYSSVRWSPGSAILGRVGARVQYTAQSGNTLWQPFARVNLWHGNSDSDRVALGGSEPIGMRIGDTALQAGIGLTARVGRNVSLYALADYRWTLDDVNSSQDTLQGVAGLRVNW
ncbi:autotransporter family protein [Neoroseomonas marina]